MVSNLKCECLFQAKSVPLSSIPVSFSSSHSIFVFFLHFADQRLYWCDAGLNLIQSITLNGRNRVIHFLYFKLNIHPFDIAVYNSTIYWTDWALPNLVELPYGSPQAELVGPGIFQQAGGLHIYQGKINTWIFILHCIVPLIDKG